jgi:exonuclease 3'-5' domain-containing protein 1
MQLHYIDTVEGMAPALATIRASSRLSVDCEGVALSRTGTICLVQVSTACDPVTRLYHCFLFDVVALGASTFTTGLGAILSAPTPVKLFYDMRRDSEALFHQFGIHLRGVCDMQLMELASRRARNQSVVYLPGLARLLGDRFTDLDAELQAVKDGMSGKYEQQPDLWQRRPLTKEQTIYAAVDVVLLHLLLDELITPPKDKLKDHGAAPPAATAAAAAQAEADAATAAAATVTSLSPSDSQEVVSRPVARSAMYVNEQTRQLVEQYSEIVWSASIRSVTQTRTQSTHPRVPP